MITCWPCIPCASRWEKACVRCSHAWRRLMMPSRFPPGSPRWNSSPQRIAEWHELMKKLTTVWHVIEEGDDFPWYKCRETAFTLETRAHWTGILHALIAAVAQLHTTADAYADTVGVDAPV